MYLKYSTGFLIASLFQAGIIIITEFLGLSTLGANLTVIQILIHIIVGQIVGYILLLIIRNLKIASAINVWTMGTIAGITAWLIILSINSALGKIKAPWTQGFSSVLSSIIAFISFRIISTYTIKKYGYRKS
jgi:hypothetical protein